MQLAKFFRDVYSPNNNPQALLSAGTVAKMKATNKLTNQWCPGCQYGLAAFQTYDRTDPAYSYATTRAYGTPATPLIAVQRP